MSWKTANIDMIEAIKRERTYSQKHLDNIITKHEGKELFFLLCEYFEKCFKADLPTDEELISRHGAYL